MKARGDRGPPPEPARNRCRCGHFPTTHMVVVASSSASGFQLDPTGPCAVCRESLCPKFTPAV